MTKEIKKKYISLLGLDVIEQNACDPDLLIEETKEFETYTAWSAAHVSLAPKPKNESLPRGLNINICVLYWRHKMREQKEMMQVPNRFL